MKTARRIAGLVSAAAVAAVSLGCAEAKIGVGPFKAMSVEVGPGGFEAKGPSAGPLKTKSIERD